MNNITDLKEFEGFSLQNEIKKYSRSWKWFLVSIFICALLALIYLKKTPYTYNAVSTILIKDEGEGRGLSELAAFEDLTGMSGGSNDIDDEVDIIRSKTLLERVVKKLNVSIIQSKKDGLKYVDIYGSTPIEAFFQYNDNYYKFPGEDDFIPFKIELKTGNVYKLIDEDLGESYEVEYDKLFKHKYGDLIIKKTSLFNDNFKKEEPLTEVYLNIGSLEKVALIYQTSLSAAAKSKRSSLLDLSLKSSNLTKAYDFINTLVDIYNEEAIDDKNLISKNTIEFVDKRLEVISKELKDVENFKTEFKENKGITNISTESQLFVEQIGDSQKNILEVETQLSLVNYMLDYLSKQTEEFDLLPANIGIESQSVNTAITTFNKNILERKRLLENSTELNPIVKDLTYNVKIQKENLLKTLSNQKNNFEITKRQFNKQKGKINSKIKGIPKIEQDIRVIARQQRIKENLYLFLLKKKEDLSISITVTAPPAKIIDRAYSTGIPVAPRRMVILATSLILGFLIPFVAIYVKDLFDTKVKDRIDVENVLKNTPLLVEVARVKKGTSDVLKINDRSVLGESFRILRTNLNYLGKSKKKEGKALRVFITSTVKGEGKTFVSFNTVLALADSNKKILVIGADIRNPQLHRYLKNDKNQRGLSDYLYDNTLQFEEIVNKVTFNNHNIDYVTSGRIPPNPSELLMNGRLEHLLDYLDENHDYDYIIVDTAPTMLVTDTLIICESADVTIYVVRADYTDRNLLTYAKQLKDDGKVQGMAIVLNDVKEGRIGYGYSYGYGETKKKWYQNFFSKS